MAYELMLLADPGPPREAVLRALTEDAAVRRDTELDNRFWLKLDDGEAQVNIGTKDPVESVHAEFPAGDAAHMEASVRRILELASHLEMRVEDCLWGHEVTPANLAELKAFWQSQPERRNGPPQPAADGARPWWRFW